MNFKKKLVSIEGTTATTVSNVSGGNFSEIFRNRIEICASAAHLQLRTHPKKGFVVH